MNSATVTLLNQGKDREDDDQKIHDVMREEQARGRRHLDTAELEKQRRLKKLFIDLARETDDEKEFRRRVNPLLPQGADLDAVVAVWRELRRQLR